MKRFTRKIKTFKDPFVAIWYQLVFITYFQPSTKNVDANSYTKVCEYGGFEFHVELYKKIDNKFGWEIEIMVECKSRKIFGIYCVDATDPIVDVVIMFCGKFKE